jgi:hypothetical protein
MQEYEIISDNGTIDGIICKSITEAIETYCLIYGCPKEYVKEHCIVRPMHRRRKAVMRDG